MANIKSSPLEIVKLYIQHTSNEGNPDWVPKLCANPMRRHEANTVTEVSHEQQMERFRTSKLRVFEPYFSSVLLQEHGDYVTWIWNMELKKGDKLLCGIEVFRVENGLITDVWNSAYVEGKWG
jgi:hypothetical protein